MNLKSLTFPEFNLNESFFRGLKKISEMSKFQKVMTILWIMGPFIFLIERDPADLWLTSIGVIFLIRVFLKKKWEYFFQTWFICAVILWFIGLLSALLSPYTSFSLFQGLVWIRFPIYALAAQSWLGRDKDIRLVMFVSIVFGMLLMCTILLSELIFDPKIRLTWPYGDLVPGSYLSKVSLPIFCCLTVIGISSFSKKRIKVMFLPLLSLVMIFLTGERGNFIIRFFSGIFSCFLVLSKIKFFLFSTFFCLILTIIYTATTSIDSKILDRYSKNFIKNIPVFNTSNENQYWGSWRGGIEQGLEFPILGLGPSSSRIHCKKQKTTNTYQIHTNVYLNRFNYEKVYKNKNNFSSTEMHLKYINENFKIIRNPSWLPGINHCGNHPHNFYIQLFAETGVLGLLFGIMLFLSIIIKCYKAKKYDPNCPMMITCFITPLALFFPFQQTGSFYGQWGNLFLWFAIGYALTNTKVLLSKNTKSLF